ncbi:MAG: hypothetical protein HRT47_10620 [Candidatus Caenarcaniphilales bacterium]|nr:hypothetical protein [Candidatus Caenarcaniphilales bacterium]
MKFPLAIKLKFKINLSGGSSGGGGSSSVDTSSSSIDPDLFEDTDILSDEILETDPIDPVEDIEALETEDLEAKVETEKEKEVSVADEFIAAKAEEENNSTPSINKNSDNPGGEDTFTSSSLANAEVGTLSVGEDPFTSSPSPGETEAAFDPEALIDDWENVTYGTPDDLDISFLSLDRPEEINDGVVSQVLDKTGDTFVYSPEIIETRERLATARENGTLEQEIAILNNTDRESLSKENRAYVDNFNKLYDDASGLTGMLEANSIWESVSIKVKSTPTVISDISPPGLGIKDGDRIASADIEGQGENAIDQASFDFTRSAWKYYNSKEVYSNDKIDFSKHENLKLDDNFVEYLDLSNRLSSEESIKAYYTGEDAQAKLDADFERFQELDRLHVANIGEKINVTGDSKAQTINTGQTSATEGIAATRENVTKSFKIYRGRLSEELGRGAEEDEKLRDQLIEKGASQEDVEVVEERMRARKEAQARIDSMTEEEEKQFSEDMYQYIQDLKNSDDPEKQKYGEQLEKDYKIFQETGELPDGIVAFITERAANDPNSKLSETAKYVLTDRDIAFRIFKEDPEENKDTSLKEFLQEKFSRGGTRDFDEISQDLDLSSFEVEKINHNDSTIQQLKIKYDYQPSIDSRSSSLSSTNSDHRTSMGQQIANAQFAREHGLAPTPAGQSSPSFEARVKTIMQLEGVPREIAELMAKGATLEEITAYIDENSDKEAVLASLGLNQEIEIHEQNQGKKLSERDNIDIINARNSGLRTPLAFNDEFLGIQFG